MVVTSLVELSGDHFGECAFSVAKLTSEYGIPDGELKQGNNRLPKSTYMKMTLYYIIVILLLPYKWALTAFAKNILSPFK